MASSLKIKEEYKATIVGFGDSGLPLGQRSEADLIKLAGMAKYDQHLANYFESLPTDEKLEEIKVGSFLQANPAPVTGDKNTDKEQKNKQ